MSRESEGTRVWTSDSERRYTQHVIGRARAANRPMLGAFAQWLATSRGLEAGTITVRLGSASRFVGAVTASAGKPCAAAFRSLTGDGVEDFFVRYGKDHGMAARRSMQAAMRLFLVFAVERGWLGRHLVGSVPSLRSYRLAGLPRGLSERQLKRMLGMPWEGGECWRRDRAIVYLLASYGVRRSQVSTLLLGDIDWQERTIGFAAHKGGKTVCHALTSAVARVLAEYLRDGRPRVDCPQVFLRQRRPYQGLSPMAITDVVRARMMRCGLPPRGPHALRHAFATRLLRAGQPVKVIADLLGHRSLDAVAIYAKVDHAGLLELAGDWPEAVS
jgi:integrase/recombinase XerD